MKKGLTELVFILDRSVGIDKKRAANYHSDHIGTKLNYEVLSEAMCAMRAGETIPDDWADSIEEDYQARR